MKELSNEEIIAMYELQDIINSNFNEDKFYGFDLDLDSFFLRCRNLKTQIYGLRVQAYLSTLLKYKTTPSSEDCGDFKTRENEDVEFKCSFLDKSSRQINVKNLRQWQDIDYYYVFSVDYTDYKNIIYKCYKLTKRDMKSECALLNAQPVHSTKKSNENNEKIELGFSIKLNSEHFIRWEENYLNKKFDLRKLSEERLLEIKSEQEINNQLAIYRSEIERLKVNHPEEIERLRKIKEEKLAEWQKTKDEYLAKVQKRKDAYIRKRERAFAKIPQSTIIKHYESLKSGKISGKQYAIIMDFEIVQRYTRRKRKIEMISNESFSIMFNTIMKRYSSKLTDYKQFCDEFHDWYQMYLERNWIKRKHSLKEKTVIEVEQTIEAAEETEDEYFDRKMEESRKTSVY